MRKLRSLVLLAYRPSVLTWLSVLMTVMFCFCAVAFGQAVVPPVPKSAETPIVYWLASTLVVQVTALFAAYLKQRSSFQTGTAALKLELQSEFSKAITEAMEKVNTQIDSRLNQIDGRIDDQLKSVGEASVHASEAFQDDLREAVLDMKTQILDSVKLSTVSPDRCESLRAALSGRIGPIETKQAKIIALHEINHDQKIRLAIDGKG